MYCSEMIELKVIAVFNEEGDIKPLKLIVNNRAFNIQRIYSIRKNNPLEFLKGTVVEYKVMVCNQTKYVYHKLEDNTWFSVKNIAI